MLSRTQSLGQAQPGVLAHPGAGCPPTHARQGWDAGDAGSVPTACWYSEHGPGWQQGMEGAEGDRE